MQIPISLLSALLKQSGSFQVGNCMAWPEDHAASDTWFLCQGKRKGKILESLTKREREIANLVAQGQSNPEIAANPDIAERTVKAHLSLSMKRSRPAAG
jgi:DNA-binding NarL/FixJ family response regulator